MTTQGPILVRLAPESSGAQAYGFTLAGRSVVCDSPLMEVLPQDRVLAVPAPDWSRLAGAGGGPAAVDPYARSRGFIAGKMREIFCRGDESHIFLEIPSIGTFSLDAAGARQHLPKTTGDEGSAAPPTTAELQQAVLGPLLILVLALRGVFCLHCSAAARKDRACLFLGESGVGKSTLGAALGRAGWERLADDLLPVETARGELGAWTDFPQLKEPLQPSREWLTVQHLYVLAEGPEVKTEPLTRSEAALALAANTAAARLFPRALLARHLAAMTDWASQVAVERLTYPRRFETLPEVGRLLAERA